MPKDRVEFHVYVNGNREGNSASFEEAKAIRRKHKDAEDIHVVMVHYDGQGNETSRHPLSVNED